MSFADVSSANEVGYNNLKLKAGGKNLLGPNMLTIGSKEQIRLSDLKITGYEEAYLEDMEVWEGGKWGNAQTGEFITKDNDVTIEPGEAFWVTVPSLTSPPGYTAGAFLFVVPTCLEK